MAEIFWSIQQRKLAEQMPKDESGQGWADRPFLQILESKIISHPKQRFMVGKLLPVKKKEINKN